MWSRNKANLYIRDALDDFHYDPKALPSPIAQRKIYRNKLMLTHLVGFGGGASALAGTSYDYPADSDYLQAPHSADWDFGSGDFTLDTWVRLDGPTTLEPLCSQAEDGNAAWYWNIRDTGPGINFKYTTDGTNAITHTWSTWTASADTWYHIMVALSGDDFRCFIDGTQLGDTKTMSDTIYNSSKVLQVAFGGNGGASGLWHYDSMQGFMDEFRISKGVARETSNFTPSIVEYSSDVNTQLLIHCSETILSGTTGSGATFTDSGNTGHTITEIGSAIRSSDQFVF